MGIADFVQEINFMKTLGVHPNLIRLIGTSSHQHLVSSPNHRLVVEYCENGDLLHLIRRRRQEMISRRNVDGVTFEMFSNKTLT
jgi:serine/threonine protein kinase